MKKHFTPSEWLSSKMQHRANTCCQVHGEKRTLVYCWWDWVDADTMTISLEVPQKIMIQQFYLWGFSWRKQKHQFEKIHACQCSH